MKKNEIILELSSDQRDLILKHCSFDDPELSKVFSISVKKGNAYHIPVSYEQLENVIDCVYDRQDEVNDEKLYKKFEKLIDHLESYGDEFFEDVIMSDLSEMTGMSPDNIMSMAEEMVSTMFGGEDFVEGEEDYSKYSENKGDVLILKVFLAGDKNLWRTIAIREQQTLLDLHETIFEAFDRYDPHMFSFFLPENRKSELNPRSVYKNSMEFTAPFNCEMENEDIPSENSAKTKIADLELQPGEKLFYLFDFGDEWWHEIVVEEITKPNKRQYPRILESEGESPDQYPDIDQEW